MRGFYGNPPLLFYYFWPLINLGSLAHLLENLIVTLDIVNLKIFILTARTNSTKRNGLRSFRSHNFAGCSDVVVSLLWCFFIVFLRDQVVKNSIG